MMMMMMMMMVMMNLERCDGAKTVTNSKIETVQF